MDDKVEFKMVLSSPLLLQGLAEYGPDVVGLDSVWKYTKYKIPVWVLVFPVATKSSVGAYFICSDGTAESLRWCIEKVLLKVPARNWWPLVMIDHDDAERLACELNGFKVLLCRFHSKATFTEKVKQLLPQKDVAEAHGHKEGTVLRLVQSEEIQKWPGKVGPRVLQLWMGRCAL